MSRMFSFVMCFMNYLPLWLIIELEWIRQAHVGALGAGVALVFVLILDTAIALFWVIARGLIVKRIRRVGNKKYVIQRYVEEKTMTAEVLLSYVLPLIAFDFTTWMGWISFGLFFVIVTWLSTRHRIASGGLFWEICGYWCYSCEVISIDKRTNVALNVIVYTANRMDGENQAVISLNQLNNGSWIEVKDGGRNEAH